MSVLAHLSVVGYPSQGASVGRYVRRAVEILRESGLRHEVHAMGTEIECAQLSDLWPVLERIDAALQALGATRTSFQLKVDHRLDRATGLEEKRLSALPRTR